MVSIKIDEESNSIYSYKTINGEFIGQRLSFYDEEIKPKDVKYEYKQIRDMKESDSGILLHGFSLE